MHSRSTFPWYCRTRRELHDGHRSSNSIEDPIHGVLSFHRSMRGMKVTRNPSGYCLFAPGGQGELTLPVHEKDTGKLPVVLTVGLPGMPRLEILRVLILSNRIYNQSGRINETGTSAIRSVLSGVPVGDRFLPGAECSPVFNSVWRSPTTLPSSRRI